MPSLSSRRRPWPWDARLKFSPTGGQEDVGFGKYGLMLVAQQTSGLIVGKKQTPLANTYFPDAAYGSSPVYKEHTFEFKPNGGFGESVQSSKTDKRYHYAMDCWVTGGLFGLGPLTHQIVPPTTGPIRRFIEALSGGVLHLFVLAGANVLIRNDDSNAGQGVSRTRAGQVATDAARYAGLYASPVNGLYVAWSDGVLEEYNGTAWTGCVLPAGFAPQFLQVLGDELWAADPTTCQIRKCTNDPKLAGSWGGPIQIGTPAIPITALRQTLNRLYIFKADGDVFTVNSDGSDNDLYPGLDNTVDLTNCRTAVAWQGSLWFRADRAFWQLDGSGPTLSPQGPGRALANLSEVRGPVQAFAGWNSQLAFGVTYNTGNGNSYLLTYGNWEPQQGDVGTSFAFVNQWDGAIAHWVGRQATCLEVSNIPSDARLYVGFADGGYDWIKLVPYPLIPNSGAEFVTSGYVVAPLHHDMFEADIKQLIGFSVFGPSFPLQAQVNIDYRLGGSAGMPATDPGGSWLSGTNPFTYNGQRQNLSPSVAAVAFEVQVNLSSSSSASSPVLEGVGFHERLVPAFRLDWSMTVDARDLIARRDGATTRQSGRFIRDLMQQAAAAPVLVTLELPDESVTDVAVFDYTERMMAHPTFMGQGWGIDVQVTQFDTQGTYGSIGRTRGTSIGALRGWQIGQLRHF